MPDSLIIERPGVLSAANHVAALGVSGYGGVAIQIQGTFTGTITFEASVQGAEFEPLRVVATDNSTAVTTATGTGIFVGSAVGLTTVRARMSSYTNGAASVLIRAVMASPGGSGGGGGAGTDVNLVEVGGQSIALGETTMSASLPVVIASDQTPIPITGSITAENNAAGPVGDPIPADASSTAFEDPSGNLETFKLESFDYDTTGSTQAQTAIGLVTPSATGPLPVSTTNPLPIGDAGGSITVDGTVAATQSGTWNITNVSGTVSLPTGAATAALQTQPGVDIGDVTVNNASGASAVNIQDGGNSITVDYATTGSGTATGALRVELPTNGTGVIATVAAVTAITNPLPAGSNSIGTVVNPALTDIGAGEYETVAASQTAQVLGATGAIGDFLAGLLVTPATTSPGNVLILDNATSITVFAGGASSVSNLVPFFIPLGIKSVSGAWKVTTGANVSCIGVGNFT